MPATKTPRKGNPGPVSYSVMFPGNAAQLHANQRARVAVGDKEVQAIVDRDVAETSKIAEMHDRQHTDRNN